MMAKREKRRSISGPVTIEVLVCPVCESVEVEDLADLIPSSALVTKLKKGVVCVECGAIFLGFEDLNRKQISFENGYDV